MILPPSFLKHMSVHMLFGDDGVNSFENIVSLLGKSTAGLSHMVEGGKIFEKIPGILEKAQRESAVARERATAEREWLGFERSSQNQSLHAIID